MVGWIKKFTAVAVVTVIAVALVSRNLDQVTLRLWPGRELSSSVGVVVIIVFFSGVAFSALISLFFGIKAYLRERKLHRNESQRLAFYNGMLKARELSQTAQWSKARESWQQLIRTDPTKVIARLELSHCLEGLGAIREALKVVDGVRAERSDSIEALLRAVELNLKLDNKTAAIDNLALIMYQQPNSKTATLARDLSEQLGRIDDALEYQKQLDRLVERDEHSTTVTQRLRLKIILRDHQDDPEELLVQLKAFVRKNDACAEGHYQLAQQEKVAGNIDSAAQQLMDAARVSQQLEYWQEAVDLWLVNNQPEKALSAARTAVRSTKGKARLKIELGLIRLYLRLNTLDQAERAIEELPKIIKQQNLSFDTKLEQELLLLRANLYCLRGQNSEASAALEKLVST